MLCIGEFVYKKFISKKESITTPDVLWDLEDIDADDAAMSLLPPEELQDNFTFKKLLSRFNTKVDSKEESANNEQKDNEDQNGGN